MKHLSVAAPVISTALTLLALAGGASWAVVAGIFFLGAPLVVFVALLLSSNIVEGLFSRRDKGARITYDVGMRDLRLNPIASRSDVRSGAPR